MLLLLPTDSNKLLLQWNGPFEVVEVLNRMDYRINVNGVTGTYHANMLKQSVERQSMASHNLMSIETIVVVGKADEADEYSLEDCTFPSIHRTETYKDVSKELTPEKK